MQINVQNYLRLVENAKTLCCFDIEATGLKGDYNSVLCVSIRPFGETPSTFAVRRPGNDERVVKEAKRALEQFDCWVTYYGKGFDVKMLNTRLLRWGSNPIEQRHHIDMYYSLKTHTLTAHRSQGHLLSWFAGMEESEDEATAPVKMGVSAEVWNKVLANPKKEMPKMIARCESDTEGLQALYNHGKHLIRDITR